jgi:DNA-binding transcriptional LysR family regulator
MSLTPHISLDQWRALMAVVEAGGYAQAAEVLHKSQSAVTYSVQKIESQLGVKAFEIQGRKAVLTPTGQMLYRRALALVGDASDLEKAAKTLSAGWEAEIGLAVEILFPRCVLLNSLAKFGAESPRTRIEVIESVMGGTADALLSGQADLAISPQVPPGFLGSFLMRLRLLAVAHPGHPLHQLGRELTVRDLAAHRHIVVRDSGSKRDRRAVTVEVEQRWTVSNIDTSIEAVCQGHGFAWYPEPHIREAITAGRLKPLPLNEGRERSVDIHLIFADPDFAGPGVKRLAELIRAAAAEECTTARMS